MLLPDLDDQFAVSEDEAADEALFGSPVELVFLSTNDLLEQEGNLLLVQMVGIRGVFQGEFPKLMFPAIDQVSLTLDFDPLLGRGVEEAVQNLLMFKLLGVLASHYSVNLPRRFSQSIKQSNF